jgi:hypothetical protein
MTKTFSEFDLAQFTGSESWYRHGITRAVLFTDGAKYVADKAGAYWLLDEIAIIQVHDARLKAEEFQVWKLAVNAHQTGVLICEDGNDNDVYTKLLEYTDFPPGGITLYFTNKTILLPSEYCPLLPRRRGCLLLVAQCIFVTERRLYAL